MDIRWFEYFLAAARHEHLGKAAEELGISQPVLSRCIMRLEEEYGAKFFDRSGRRTKLNEAGRLMEQQVERALGTLEDARRELTAITTKSLQTISIGFLATLGQVTVPSLIQRYRHTNGHATFRLVQGPHPLLEEYLRSSSIDLCLTSPRFADAKLEWSPLYQEELVLLVPRDSPLASRDSVKLSEIAHEPIIAMKKGYGLREYLDKFAKEAGFTPKIVFEGDEVATLVGLVGSGLGVTIAPRLASTKSSLFVSVPISSPKCWRTMGLSWRAGRYIPHAAAAFRTFVIKTFEAGDFLRQTIPHAEIIKAK